jgi:hypothetical protein
MRDEVQLESEEACVELCQSSSRNPAHHLKKWPNLLANNILADVRTVRRWKMLAYCGALLACNSIMQ